MRQFGIIMIALVLLICTSAVAADVSKISANNIRAEAENIIVPIELNNSVPMTALDLPMKFSEGVTLVGVSFEGTRSENFDFKWANIDNENNTVILGMIPNVLGENSDMEAGEGIIANFEFAVDDEYLESFTIEPTVMDKPNHEAMFVYSDDGVSMIDVTPEIGNITVELAALISPSAIIPESFGLKQNYPNPFNPDTKIEYDLPKAANVRIEIFNVLGQKVSTLIDSYSEAGTHQVTWNGTSDNGSSVA
ncbi:MAG: FlgD immunoglobulin-like domain containing protein, partial [Candidatus Zixiibacteriota bacterium]